MAQPVSDIHRHDAIPCFACSKYRNIYNSGHAFSIAYILSEKDLFRHSKSWRHRDFTGGLHEPAQQTKHRRYSIATGCRLPPTGNSRRRRAFSPRRRACTIPASMGAGSSDGTAGLWCVNAGHGPPTDRVRRRAPVADPGFCAVFPDGASDRLRFCRAAGGDRAPVVPMKKLDRVFFTGSGSESVDTALKIAVAYQRSIGQGTRTRLIGRERGYHGVGFGGISVGGLVNNRRVFPLIPGTDHLRHTHDPARNALHQRTAGAWRGVGRRSRKACRAAWRRNHRGLHCRAGGWIDWRAGSAERLSRAGCARSAPPMASC